MINKKRWQKNRYKIVIWYLTPGFDKLIQLGLGLKLHYREIRQQIKSSDLDNPDNFFLDKFSRPYCQAFDELFMYV
jgi:hypothetical protein